MGLETFGAAHDRWLDPPDDDGEHHSECPQHPDNEGIGGIEKEGCRCKQLDRRDREDVACEKADAERKGE